LSTHYEAAISIHLPPTVSGTYQSAVSASKTLKNFPINIVDANNVSIATGMIAVRAAEAIEANKSFDDVLKITNQAIANTKIYILLETLEFLVRGGRLTKSKRRIADLINARPILSLNEEGEIEAAGKIIGRKNRDDKFLQYLMKKIPTESKYRIGIVHGDNQKLADQFYTYFSKLIDEKDIFLSQLGPALGTHGGPGVIAVAIQSLQDDLNE
jgi:DegV family protein with EDD domain